MCHVKWRALMAFAVVRWALELHSSRPVVDPPAPPDFEGWFPKLCINEHSRGFRETRIRLEATGQVTMEATRWAPAATGNRCLLTEPWDVGLHRDPCGITMMMGTMSSSSCGCRGGSRDRLQTGSCEGGTRTRTTTTGAPSTIPCSDEQGTRYLQLACHALSEALGIKRERRPQITRSAPVN